MITLANRQSRHRAGWDWYPRAMWLWTHLLAVQTTLLVTALVLDNRRVLIASLCIGAVGIALGVPILDEYYKKQREAE